MSYADIARKRVSEKWLSEKQAKPKGFLEKQKDILEKNTKLDNKFNFKRACYRIKELDTTMIIPLNGVFKYVGTDYKNDEFKWSDGYDHRHGMIWSSSSNISVQNATFKELKEFNKSTGEDDPSGSGKIVRCS
jgi:hypothetical protein